MIKMMKQISELKNKATERANYYAGLGFLRLAEEFTEFANFLNEIENHNKEEEKQTDEI